MRREGRGVRLAAAVQSCSNLTGLLGLQQGGALFRVSQQTQNHRCGCQGRPGAGAADAMRAQPRHQAHGRLRGARGEDGEFNAAAWPRREKKTPSPRLIVSITHSHCTCHDTRRASRAPSPPKSLAAAAAAPAAVATARSSLRGPGRKHGTPGGGGANSSWGPELESRTTHRRTIITRRRGPKEDSPCCEATHRTTSMSSSESPKTSPPARPAQAKAKRGGQTAEQREDGRELLCELSIHALRSSPVCDSISLWQMPWASLPGRLVCNRWAAV